MYWVFFVSKCEQLNIQNDWSDFVGRRPNNNIVKYSNKTHYKELALFDIKADRVLTYS